jgi:ketosteroid isomerase-like protein
MKEVLAQKKVVSTATQQAIDEAAIRRQIDDHVKALHVMNLEDVMSIYAPDIVCFDLTPPLKYVGLESKRQPWVEAFEMIEPPLGYEIRDLTITVSNDVAFSHSLNRMNTKLKNGQRADFWLRWTACFRKIEDKWLIVHEQVSVPADFGSGRAVFDLEP